MQAFSLVLFILFISSAYGSDEGQRFLASCPLATDVKVLIQSTGEKSNFIQHKIIRDIKAKLYQSYTNNEITPLSKERLTSGVSVRWEDIFGYSDRHELHLAQGKSLLHGQKYKSKELLRKWVKFYFAWKWGRIYNKQIKDIVEHAKQRSDLDLGGLKSQIQKVRWTEIFHRSEELLSIDKQSQAYFSGCSAKASLRPEIEANRDEILKNMNLFVVDNDLRLYCDNEKLRYRSQLAEVHKKVKFNLGTSYGVNQQLGSEGRQFNDMRAMVDIEISLDTGSIPEAKFEQCDFEIRQQSLESMQKKATILSSIKRFDQNLTKINQINKFLSSSDPWSSFSDSEAISLIQEYILGIEQLVELDNEISSESLASNLVEAI